MKLGLERVKFSEFFANFFGISRELRVIVRRVQNDRLTFRYIFNLVRKKQHFSPKFMNEISYRSIYDNKTAHILCLQPNATTHILLCRNLPIT
jgi:hypothetical protein